MLDIVTFKWKPPRPGYRSKFGPETVNILRNMVERHYRKPHRFTCVTDDPAGLDPRIRVIPLWSDHGELVSPAGVNQPCCYRRLKLFSAAAAELIGPRFVALDLDIVITQDVAPLWDRPEDFVIWGDTNPTTLYNGSMFVLTAGARTQVWDTFDPLRSPRLTKASGNFGSDQAWISYCLGKGEATWSQADGVFSYRLHILPLGGRLPRMARVVVFHGRVDPWGPEAQRHSWVKEHYQ